MAKQVAVLGNRGAVMDPGAQREKSDLTSSLVRKGDDRREHRIRGVGGEHHCIVDGLDQPGTRL